ncbi:hypothetical protein [Mycoplana rhizolycopersici]|uniref:Uncharacterized protein n=1 Tax=Mycoplana rhizolycopersici TaxID=2746702 RepID=A0ABX2QJF9_9HYPH|nr:hypothetical protein [Rhizobium rhizolycopersici]NVP57892.1 hypothetical protein [Rhizobium rhizolycopersici]
MRPHCLPRYPIERIEADWSRIDSLIAARARADRACNRLMYLFLPTLIVGLSTFILCRS